MATTHFSGPVDSAAGFSVNGTTVITSAGAITADIQATAGSIGTAELADSGVTTDKIAAGGVGTINLADSGVTTDKIASGGVGLVNLASAVAPSHVVKYAGTYQWAGSGATGTATVAGVTATDTVVASIAAAPTEAATLSSAVAGSGTVTFVLSAANTSNDADINYLVLRATS